MYDDIKKNMNDLYIHNLETENKQLRLALQECRKALEDEITIKNKAIEYIKNASYFDGSGMCANDLLEILKGSDSNENRRLF